MTSITIHLAPAILGGFCTVPDVEKFLQVDIPAGEKCADCEAAIAAATAAIRNYCHQWLSEVQDEEITLDCAGGSKVFLPELPVTHVGLLVENGESLVAGEDDDYQLGENGILYRVGRSWAKGVQIIEVTYTHGYASLPDDIVAVCVRAGSRAYQAGLQAAGTKGLPGVASVGLGDFNAAFSSSVGGGVSEPAGGASAARMLLLSEKDILNKYRIVRP